jgi:RNA-binding protein 23/39
MEARLKDLRAAAMQRSGAGSKRARSPSPPAAAPPRAARSRTLSRSPSRTASRSPPHSRSHSRSPRRATDDPSPPGRASAPAARRGRDREDARGGGRGRADRDREWERGRERGRDREREREHGRERDRGREGERERDRHAEHRRDRERDREYSRDRDHHRDRDYHRDHDRERRLREPPVRGEYGDGRRTERGERGVEATREARDARTVFVWQVSQKAREEDVYDLFARAGRVRSVRLIVDRRSGRHKGQGYVEFHDVASVPGAIALNGSPVRGYPVAVKAIVAVDGVDGAAAMPGATASAMPVAIPQPPPPPPPPPHGVAAKTLPAASSAQASSGTLSGTNTVAAAHRSDLPPPPPPPPRLVSVQELAKLLNPNNLPLVSSSSLGGDPAAGGQGSTATATQVDNITLPESQQVPLPIPGRTQPAPPSALAAAHQPSATSFTRLYVGSVPFTVSDEDLMTVFSPFGAIVSLQLQREAPSGRSRGYGFVEFFEHTAARKALALNGIILAGRALKVNLASSTSAPVAQPLVAAQAAAASVSAGLGAVPLPVPGGDVAPPQNCGGELDEGRDGGLAMNAAQRAQLMQRLSRGEDMGTLPSANPAAAAQVYNPPCATTDEQTRCLLLSNMFDPVAEAAANPAFHLEVAEDVRDEVSEKYGAVKHLFVDKSSHGLVYLIFDDAGSALKAKSALNGRWFGGLCIAAAFVEEQVYKERIPGAPL